jgi:DNA-binding CsgD family transcriptional regulator
MNMSNNEELDTVNLILASLTLSLEADDFCMSLARDALFNFGVVATILTRLDRDGHVSILGSYGVPENAFAKDARPSLWDASPITDAIRLKRVTFVDGPGSYEDVYPVPSPSKFNGKAFAAIPFGGVAHQPGAIGIIFYDELTEDNTLRNTLIDSLANASEVFLAKAYAAAQASALGFGKTASAANTVAQASAVPSVKKIDQRDITVLELMRLGKTNLQISRSLGYSESTIRQVAVQLFKKLGVNNRNDAVAVAISQGTIGESKPEVTPAPRVLTSVEDSSMAWRSRVNA